MRLKIKEISFTKDVEWIYRLSDGIGEYFILSESFYKSHGMKSPLNKGYLDVFEIGHSILCDVLEIEGVNVVTKIR